MNINQVNGLNNTHRERQHDLLEVLVAHNPFLYGSDGIFGSVIREFSTVTVGMYPPEDSSVPDANKITHTCNTHPSSELLIRSQISMFRAQSSDGRLELVALSVKNRWICTDE